MKQQMFQTEMAPTAEVALPLQGEESRIEAEETRLTQTAAERDEADDIARLLRQYKAETQRHRIRVRRAIRGAVSVAVCMTVIDAIAILIAAQSQMESPPVIMKVCIGLLIGGAALLMLCAFEAITAATHRGRAQAKLVAMALEQDSVCMVGPLIEMLAHPRTRLKTSAKLIEVLPRMRAGDAHLLTDEHRQYLCSVLRSGAREDHELRIAILRGFAQIGDRSVLTQVERIADSPARTRRQRELKAEAQKCLPQLQARTKYEQADRTLLRAAVAASADPDSLLRSAAAGSASDPGILLRPTGSQ